MEDLATRVQHLPVELYNDILDLVLTPDAKFVTIKDDYEPPTPTSNQPRHSRTLCR